MSEQQNPAIEVDQTVASALQEVSLAFSMGTPVSADAVAVVTALAQQVVDVVNPEPDPVAASVVFDSHGESHFNVDAAAFEEFETILPDGPSRTGRCVRIGNVVIRLIDDKQQSRLSVFRSSALAAERMDALRQYNEQHDAPAQ